MGKILCATRGGAASYRTQDAVIALAKAQGDSIIFLYVVDTDFLGHTDRAVRPDVVAVEMTHLGEFLLAMACERAASRGVQATPLVKRGPLASALRDAATAEEITLVAVGQPAGDASRFQLAGLEQLAAQITEATGVETRIV
jgi:nucleotide-binding universal stress UspA family protein